MTPEKQSKLKSNGWKIRNAEDFLNDITKGLVSVYCLMTNHNQFLCFSEENKDYYLSEFKNSNLVIIHSPQKEQETIKLYQAIIGVFLTPVSNVIGIN